MICGAATTFQQFGPPHAVAIFLTAALPAALILRVRKADSLPLSKAICCGLAAVLLVNEFLHYAFGFQSVGWQGFLRDFLPLHICGLAAYLAAFSLITRRQWAYEIAYFWGLAGTTQAILTPDLQAGFPQYWFFQYFIRHSGIVAAVLLATIGLKMRPRPGSVLRVFIITNVWLVLVAGANWALDANYMYLARRPDVPSPLVILPWPWYIVLADALVLVAFALLYWPFLARNRRAT